MVDRRSPTLYQITEPGPQTSSARKDDKAIRTEQEACDETGVDGTLRLDFLKSA